MFKFLNYVLSVISFLIFSLLSACGDNGSFFNNRISGAEFSDTKEAKLIKYYSRLEERKISLGLLRQDGGGTDTPFDVDDIVEAFEQVAFYNEYDISGDKLLPNSEAVKLAKWKSNINVSVRFGNSVNKKQKDNDLLEINELIGVLSQITNRLAKYKISVKRLIQTPNKKDNKATIVIITHKTSELNCNNCLSIFKNNRNILKTPVLIRLYN